MPLEFRGKTAHVCPKCRRGVRKLSQPGSFWADVPKAFAYPLQGSGPWILIAGTPFLLLYDMLGFGLFTGIAKLVLLGVFGMLLQNVIRISSDEDGGTMEWPDTADKSEFITAGLQIVAVLLAVFAPAIACIVSSVFGFGQEYISSGVALILGVAFAIAGFVYFPMALLALAMFDTINVASPLVVIPAIARTFFQYLAVIGLIVIMWCARIVATWPLHGQPLAVRVIAFLPAEFATFYTFVVGARLLGVLYRHNASRLCWFE